MMINHDIIKQYLNELILNFPKNQDFDKDDYENLLSIIFGEMNSNQPDLIIKSLLNTLLYNYINRKEIYPEYYSDSILNKKRFLPIIFDKTEDNLLNIIDNNRTKFFRERNADIKNVE